MATINKALRFNNLTKKTSPYRAKVVIVDDGRVKVARGENNVWVNNSMSLTIDDYVIVENNMVVKKLPSLPYNEVAVY